MIRELTNNLERRYVLLLLILFASLLSAARLGSAVVYRDYSIVLIIFAPLLWFAVLKSNLIPILTILFIVSFAEWATEGSTSLSLLPPQIMWVPELLSGLIFVEVIISRCIKQERVNLFGMWIVMSFLGITSFSLIYNNTDMISALLFLRPLFRYYILFLAIINLDLDDNSMKLVNKILVFIFLVQLPLSIIKLFLYGQGEQPLGLNSHGSTTAIALIAAGFIFSYYFLFKKPMVSVLLLLGFMGFGVIGGKRAFIFFIPIVFAYLFWYMRKDMAGILKQAFLVLLAIFLSTYLAFRLIPTLNPERKVWGQFDPTHIASYAYDYTTKTSHSGLAIGRTSAAIAIFKHLSNSGSPSLLLGFGPGTVTKSMFRRSDRMETLYTTVGVGYGVSGLSWLALQVGYIGAFAYLTIFYLILRKSALSFAMEVDPYWACFGLGMVGFSFVMLLISLLYMQVFITDSISAFYFCLSGFVVSRASKMSSTASGNHEGGSHAIV